MASGRVNRIEAEHMAAPTNTALVKKVLANSEPSTHGTSRHFAGLQNLVAVGGIADIGTRWPEGSVACDPTATSSIARSARYLNRQHMIL